MSRKFWNNSLILFTIGMFEGALIVGWMSQVNLINASVRQQYLAGALFIITGLVFALQRFGSRMIMFGMATHAWGIATLAYLDMVQISVDEQFVVAGVTAVVLGLCFLFDWYKNRGPHKDSVRLT